MSAAHPLHCPVCDLRAADIAEGSDPFANREPFQFLHAISATCPNGHTWIEAEHGHGAGAKRSECLPRSYSATFTLETP